MNPPEKIRRRRDLNGRDLNAEARIQAAIVEWIRTVAPQVLVFAVPNGGLRSKAEAARLKWTGVVPGIPDLEIIAPPLSGNVVGRVFFMEVKVPADPSHRAGALSKDQRVMRDLLDAFGIPRKIVRSIDDARDALRAWDISTREAIVV